MNGTKLNNKELKDNFMGEAGFCVWIAPIAFIVFLIISIFCLFVSISESFSGLQEYLVLFLGNITFVLMSIWFLYESITALNIIQEIEVGHNFIALVFYFRKKGKIKFDGISSISLLDKNSFLLKKHRCVQTDKPCLQIKTKDNKFYLITPNMDRFEELKLELETLINETK